MAAISGWIFRLATVAEGKKLSGKRRCKFLEVSALLDHKVDEVLATIVRDSRLRQRRLRVNGNASMTSQQADDARTQQKGCLRLSSLGIFRKLFN